MRRETGTREPIGLGMMRQSTTTLRVTQRILLVLGVLLLAIYVGARLQSIILSRAAMRELAAQRESVAPSDAPAAIDFSLWSEKRIAAFTESLSTKTDPAIAVLRIPKIRLEAPVFEGTDDLTLNRGLGRIVGTAQVGEDGNVGISGHRDGFFRALKDVGPGDAVELTTSRTTATYIVDTIQIVYPKDVQVLKRRPVRTLTLTTCYPFYFVGDAPQRYIVQAHLQQQSYVVRRSLGEKRISN